MSAAFNHAWRQTPTNWGEFVAMYELIVEEGASDLTGDQARAMAEHAYRFAGGTENAFATLMAEKARTVTSQEVRP